ncbi:recombinase family protein [Oscillibacter sp.]|uniref:recombinase family protein n=1 Tax=Oscillibacter sp. TaxID=1945593 RepID=UPI00261630BB|nr:recombinase family protein [Oscillibacter sp.]MDD3346482.1 recombinase family protein [Oscillibacter sp.]
MIRVAAYCRVSTDKDDQANSFESQQKYFRECIDRNPDWELQDIYADEGLSGTSTKKRKRFNQMIAAARSEKIDLIITKEVSRFARNTVDTLEYTRELRKRGVGVLFLLDNINTMDTDGELRLTIMSSMAQDESRKTSERVKWGQTRRMEQGVVFGREPLGYDVKNGCMTVNPEGAAVVRYIFHKYLVERKGTPTIAKELCAEGILSSRGNLKWSSATVLKLLRNEKYCGDLIQKKTYTPDFLTHEKKYNKGQEELVILRDHHEAIIDRETWETVQRELNRRSHHNSATDNGHGNRYPLSGKMKCGNCGSSFLSRKKKTRSGKPKKIWRCGKATIEGKLRADAQGNPIGCDFGHQIREEVAMDILRRSIEAVQLDAEGVIANLTHIVETVLKDAQDDGSGQQRRLELDLEAERQKKQKTLEGFLNQSISKADYKFMNDRYDAAIAGLLQKLDAIEERRKLDTQATGARRDIKAAIRKIVTEKKSDNFCGQLLDRMTIYADGRVEVALKLLPSRWFFLLEGVWNFRTQMQEQQPSELPISVSSAFNSG